MRKIGVLTSGGDAPGMNAAVRAVVRCAAERGWEVVGVQHGYAGLISGTLQPLTVRDVGGILQRGGTILGSARSPEFRTQEGRERALRNLAVAGAKALVVIGGNGSQSGAHLLCEMEYPVVGIASTIDNDLAGSDITIGVDTALNIALEAIDRLKTTASSHQRAMLVEVMGRDCGYLALMAALAGGAEAVVLPEVETDPRDLAEQLRDAYRRGKAHAVIVVAEGAKYNAETMAAYFGAHPEECGFDLRVTKLGHVQRGGAPGAFDRILGTRLGAGAVDALARGQRGVLVGIVQGEVTATPLAEVVGRQKPLDLNLMRLNEVLARC
jgi:6-phosphofructokinase 1